MVAILYKVNGLMHSIGYLEMLHKGSIKLIHVLNTLTEHSSDKIVTSMLLILQDCTSILENLKSTKGKVSKIPQISFLKNSHT